MVLITILYHAENMMSTMTLQQIVDRSPLSQHEFVLSHQSCYYKLSLSHHNVLDGLRLSLVMGPVQYLSEKIHAPVVGEIHLG